MDVFTAFLRKNDLISCSEAFNLADYFLTDRCSSELIFGYRILAAMFQQSCPNGLFQR